MTTEKAINWTEYISMSLALQQISDITDKDIRAEVAQGLLVMMDAILEEMGLT